MGGEVHTRAIMCVSWSPDSQFIATGSRDKTIKLHNALTKQDSICSFNMHA